MRKFYTQTHVFPLVFVCTHGLALSDTFCQQILFITVTNSVVLGDSRHRQFFMALLNFRHWSLFCIYICFYVLCVKMAFVCLMSF